VAGSEDCFRCAAVHPDGRLLACGMEDGFGLWDLVTGTPLAFVPMKRVKSVLFEPSGALLTLSLTGLSRWPIDKGWKSTGELSIGPPEPLRLSVGSSLSESHDGRVIAACDRAVSTEQPFAGGWILHPDSPQEPIRLDLGADLAFIAVSPNGRWVVTATFEAGLAKIWDARDGRLVKRLANWGVKSPCFSPDGRWLATSLDGGCLFAVETWERGPRVGECAVFSPDSKLTAAPTSKGIRLIDPATGGEIALLEDPNRDPVDQAVFSPNGTKLVVVSLTKGIHIWDLRLIRRQLKDRGLDWDWPEFPPATATRPVVEPVKVEIRLGKDKAAGLPIEKAASARLPTKGAK
jgi:WD40 repeat protein